MLLSEFLNKLRTTPKEINFDETMSAIDSLYEFCPSTFRNGALTNPAGSNSGSCKLFAFALRHNLTSEQTLACFGDYYREDVLKKPDADDHQNIRNFVENGWNGISFVGQPLLPKSTRVF